MNQIEEMNQKLSHTRQNHSEVQEELSEANNKISQACLVSFLSLIQYYLSYIAKCYNRNYTLTCGFDSSQDKAILSTQVLKLEDNIKELQAKLTRDLSDKDHLIQVSSLSHLRSIYHVLNL